MLHSKMDFKRIENFSHVAFPYKNIHTFKKFYMPYAVQKSKAGELRGIKSICEGIEIIWGKKEASEYKELMKKKSREQKDKVFLVEKKEETENENT